MNNEARVSPLGDPLAGTARNVRRCNKNRMTVATTAVTATITTTMITTTKTITITTTTTTERRYECGSGVRRRPRLLKVRDGSVAETLPSFAFNPDPHFVGAWSILHPPPFPVAVVLKPFLPPRLGQPGERAPHCLSFSPAISARVPFSLPISRFLPLAPAAILRRGSPRGFSPSLSPSHPPWITIRSWNTMNNNGRRDRSCRPRSMIDGIEAHRWPPTSERCLHFCARHSAVRYAAPPRYSGFRGVRFSNSLLDARDTRRFISLHGDAFIYFRMHRFRANFCRNNERLMTRVKRWRWKVLCKWGWNIFLILFTSQISRYV